MADHLIAITASATITTTAIVTTQRYTASASASAGGAEPTRLRAGQTPPPFFQPHAVGRSFPLPTLPGQPSVSLVPLSPITSFAVYIYIYRSVSVRTISRDRPSPCLIALSFFVRGPIRSTQHPPSHFVTPHAPYSRSNPFPPLFHHPRNVRLRNDTLCRRMLETR